MHMPYLNSQSSTPNMITEFGGYNHNPVINEAEFYDMKNLTSDKYPLASNRDKRGFPEIELPSGAEIIDICGNDSIYVVYKSGTELRVCHYNPNTETLSYDTLVGTYVSGKHYVIEMGAYICIFPEKRMVNIKQAKDGKFIVEKMGIELSSQPGFDTDLRVNTNLGATVAYVGSSPPKTKTESVINKDEESGKTSSTSVVLLSVDNGNTWSEWKDNTLVYPYFRPLWVDTSTDEPVAKAWSSQQNQWISQQIYMYFSVSNTFDINDGDAVEITFSDSIKPYLRIPDNQKYFVISEEETNSTTKKLFKIKVNLSSKEKDASYPDHLGGYWITKIKRKIPEMDYIIESQNRLWGCKFGVVDGEPINEIFASKLADPKNWHYFSNTSVDSYYVSLGSDGGFTGAVNYQTNPVFFKRDCIHRITGNYPAQYTLSTIQAYGVKGNCDRSVIVMNDVCYYMSEVGMLAWTGGQPQSLAEPFGNIIYSDAVSGYVGNKLYVSMKNESNTYDLFTFDDSKIVWHKEDNLKVVGFTSVGHECIAATDDKLISLAGVYGSTKEDTVEWSMTSGEIGYDTPMRKRLLKLVMRLKLDINARAKIEIQYDGDGTWRYVNDLRPSGRTGGYSVPICPTRCDHFSIRISGKGNIELMSITKFYKEGSDKD